VAFYPSLLLWERESQKADISSTLLLPSADIFSLPHNKIKIDSSSLIFYIDGGEMVSVKD